MGLKAKLKGSLRHVWSPITVWMADQGSDQLVYAGKTAKVAVDVRGEDDGTADRVEVVLRRTGVSAEPRGWPLGEVPPRVGLHEIEVQIPTELAPSCATYSEYSFYATLHRTKGIESSAASIVDVVARPEDIYWPDGPRSGLQGGDARIEIELDEETISVGTPLTGRAIVVAAHELGGHDVVLTVAATVITPEKPKGRVQRVAKVELAHATRLADGERLDLPFSVEVPAGVPPTLHNGGTTSVVWQVRVELGDSAGWRLIGVHDPDGSAGIRDRPSPSLLSFLASLDSSPQYN